jgi:predicted ArsR family transcriptional regulator
MLQATSINAYQNLRPTLTKKQAAVREVLLVHGSKALFEIKEILGWEVNSVSGRLTELERAKVIARTGERRRNPKTGQPGDVWKLTYAPPAPSKPAPQATLL